MASRGTARQPKRARQAVKRRDAKALVVLLVASAAALVTTVALFVMGPATASSLPIVSQLVFVLDSYTLILFLVTLAFAAATLGTFFMQRWARPVLVGASVAAAVTTVLLPVAALGAYALFR